MEAAVGIESGKDKGSRQRLTVRKVVILAAGRGSRLRERKNELKPMRRVLGLPLLERVVLACKAAGLSDFLVVTGYKPKPMRSFLARLARKRSVDIDVVENPDWEKGNGTSLLACCRKLTEPFVLVMGDHLFEPELLAGLLRVDSEDDSCFLAIDRRTERVFDLRGATKVASRSGCITAIGKDLESYNGIDTGVFLLTPAIFQALAKAQAKGGYGLSDGIAELAAEGRMQAYDIGERFWLDVDTPRSLREAKRHLARQVDKPSEDGFIARYLNRPLSIRLSLLLAHTPVTPNTITLISFTIALLGAWLFTRQGYLPVLFAGVLIQGSSIIDGCDGEIARLKALGSRFGAFFDTLLDRYADLAIATGITYGFWLTHPEFWVWLAGIGALSGFLLTSYAKKEYQLRFQKPPPLSFLPRLAKRDLRLFVIFLGAVVGQPFFAMLGVGVISHLAVFWILVRGRRN
ncbi:MAG: hypothetical protein E3J71_10300 [Candidatus Stahlbacteria bacterium]|nr:MAG: hypothetical protein E3J71_10300 [Candidatus Stahlbacteria bacterium]